MKELIGLVGNKGAGKDTAAWVLVQQEGFTNVKFAGALKTMLQCYLSYVGEKGMMIDRMIDGDLKETPVDSLRGKTPRHAMQTLGTEWGREIIGPDIWVNACLLRCQRFDKVVISDCRFRNEAAAIHAAGGKLIRVSRETGSQDDHPSEAMIDSLDVDFEIINNGSVDELHRKMLTILGKESQ